MYLAPVLGTSHCHEVEGDSRLPTETIQVTKQRNETTSARAASAASKVLSNPKSSAAAKTAAASALTQARNKGK